MLRDIADVLRHRREFWAALAVAFVVGSVTASVGAAVVGGAATAVAVGMLTR